MRFRPRRRWWLLLLPALALGGWWWYARQDLPGDIIFVSDRDGRTAIYRMHANGIGVRRLLGSRDTDYLAPVVSPDGKYLAYVEAGNGWVAEITGAHPRRLIRDEDVQSMAFFPDSRSLVYTVRQKKGYSHLYRINLDGAGKRQLTFGKHSDLFPTVSPDGKFIVFSSNRSGNYDLYRLNANGSGLRRLTTHPKSDNWPVISPDGRWIAFVSDRSGTGNGKLYLIDIHGRHPRRLTSETARMTVANPAFSPDGKRIAYSVSGNHRGSKPNQFVCYADIRVINLDGSGCGTLTNNARCAALLALPGIDQFTRFLRFPDSYSTPYDEDPVWVPAKQAAPIP